MLDFLPISDLWRSVPHECRASFLEACPDALGNRLWLTSKIRGFDVSSDYLTEDEVRAALTTAPQGEPRKLSEVLTCLGDKVVDLLLEPTAAIEWLSLYLIRGNPTYTSYQRFAEWVLSQDGPPTTEVGLRKTAEFTKIPLPDGWVVEGNRVEFLRKVGAPAAAQILAHSWPEISDDTAWDIIAGDAASYATEVAEKEWYRVAGWHHVPTILSYRKYLFLKALSDTDLSKFCPHALWWDDSCADNLPGVDWEAETCSPAVGTADMLLTLLWVPASTPERAHSIREMALKHQGLSQKWDTLASAAQGRISQNRPAIDLATVSDLDLLDKMITRCRGKSGQEWPKRFPEIVQLATNPNVTVSNLHADSRKQLTYVIPGTPLHKQVLQYATTTTRQLQGLQPGPATPKPAPPQNRRPGEDAYGRRMEPWATVAAWDHTKQVAFWKLLDSLVESTHDDVQEYARTAASLVDVS